MLFTLKHIDCYMLEWTYFFQIIEEPSHGPCLNGERVDRKLIACHLLTLGNDNLIDETDGTKTITRDTDK